MMSTQALSVVTPHTVHHQILSQFTLPKQQPPLVLVSSDLAQVDDNQYEPIVNNSIENTSVDTLEWTTATVNEPQEEIIDFIVTKELEDLHPHCIKILEFHLDPIY